MPRLFLALLAAVSALGAATDLPSPSLPSDPSRGIKEGWTLLVLPDTQNYAKYAKNQPNFERMCRWVADHREAWRIGFALHQGDLVEQNDIAVGGGQGGGDQNSESQWASARRALDLLGGKLPVAFATGNHDYGPRAAENRSSRFPSVFPLGWNPRTLPLDQGGTLVETAPNAFGVHTLENAVFEHRPPFGRPVLVVALEWGPRMAVVDWAREVLARPKYANHLGILLTHSFMKPDNLRSGQDEPRPRVSGNPHNYGTGKGGDTHDGEDLWHALVKDAPQVELVFSGHEMGAHVGYRVDKAKAGHDVHQMLFNAQGLGGGSFEKGNGGDGWMRLVTFESDGRTVSVRTFSPMKLDQGKSPWWNHPRWNFTLRLSR